MVRHGRTRGSHCRSGRSNHPSSRKFGGWSLYTKAGKAKFAYNFLGLKLFTTEATKPIPSGEHQVRMEFKYDGGGLGKGGNVTVYYDGQKAGEGRVEVTQPMAFSGDEGLISVTRPART